MLFNNTSKIINKKELLSIDYVPKNIVGRDDEIKELAFHLSYFFRDNKSLPQLIIFGGTGSGKTTIVLYVLKELEKEINQKNLKLKIVRVKGSESKTKYEVLRKIISQIAPDVPITTSSADLHNKIIKVISERGINVLIFIDEIHDLRENEINGTLYTISRLGQDVSFTETKEIEKIEKKNRGSIGYILVSNDTNIRNKLKENTSSSLTREGIIFKRYSPNEIVEILKSRIEEGALFKEKIEEGVLELISASSVREGQDARYALILLSDVAKEAEKRGLDKITGELTSEVNKSLLEEFLIRIIRELPELYLEVLLIIYWLHKNNQKINSKTIWEKYNENPHLPKRDFSRISQIVTHLEKNDIVYVTQSKKTKLRELSIEENFEEIEQVLKEKGKF